MRINLYVSGLPKTQGNKTGFVNKKTGKVVMREGRRKDSADRFQAWRSDVASAAREAFERHDLEALLDEPVLARIHFSLLRPKSHPKTKPTWPTGQYDGDLDKLQRTIFDALTGTLLRDDGRIVGIACTKAWGDPPGVRISIETRDVGDDVDCDTGIVWQKADRCCHLHNALGCCDPDDCGPCCENCPTCPTLARSRTARELAS